MAFDWCFAFVFHVELLTNLVQDRVGDQNVRGVLLVEPFYSGGHIHRVSHHSILLSVHGPDVAGHHVAAIDPDPDPQMQVWIATYVLQLPDFLSHLQGAFNGVAHIRLLAEGLWYSIQSHDPIAHELAYGAVVGFDDRHHV